ncbi:hypothetical protein [Aurantimonas sp. HBX-1]|uniref:hypothetical protein n=1 Tax=Aurantimonas sp. HBX-1 TaxID=2906072 RepID=UPI001F4861CD|nr:hypothetical protein [Aurantimonas sp. HBX-1]UIJ73295.1 hypothetical protein LXB15_06530 [Aurantimonas sp. HBX-1]
MSGTAEGMNASQEASGREENEVRMAALERFHSGLEKLHLAEAELASIRADMARNGINVAISDSLHW